MNILKPQKRLRVLRAIHFGVFFLFFVSLGLVFYSEEFSIYGSTAILFMGAVQYSYGGHCPLTIEENKLRRSMGERSNRRFVESFFKDYLRVNVSRHLINMVVALSIFLSLFELYIFLVNRI